MTLLAAAPPLAPELAHLAPLLAAKASLSVAVCIPARDEEGTLGAVLDPIAALADVGLVDEVIVIDDGSTDRTASVALDRGVAVVPCATGPGKGQALATAVAAIDAEILVFLDADVTNFTGEFVSGLLWPLLTSPSIQLVKAAYRRPCHGRTDEGGRVTELLARPLLRRFFPDLADVAQPLAGECAIRRRALADIDLAKGYGIEIGLLIDIARRFGRAAIAEVDLGERIHRNRPLHQLRPHAHDIVDAILDRVQLA